MAFPGIEATGDAFQRDQVQKTLLLPTDQDFSSIVFDLGRGPLIRFLLIEKHGLRWRLVIVAHHIAIDGWSLPVFVGELLALYGAKGDVATLPPAVRPYRDYIG